ncbi:general secretion pathway protein D [Halospina denitrificans]|uniref:General secretion pathway protein D n=1 Tax=Halospina denitrificans TaxID=332522 RepID=A0A4R7JYY9_9GAMM|nr:secretin N-terminal domain-containing protein [Halospina denitrificans]TDT43164.1 general secretion pathway protein D [Halospina denitrificans]
MTRIRRVFLVLMLSLLLPMPLAAQEEVSEGETADTWTVNLKEADIRALVDQVSDITGYSFVVDPRVKGKVTVVSETPMKSEEVYDLFLSVLHVHGFTAVPGDDVIKVIQQSDAKQSAENISRFTDVPSEQLMTRVIRVENISAMQLVPILRPMIASYGHLAGVSSSNALIISDHQANIERMRKLIDDLDEPTDYEMEVIQLEEAWVGDMVEMLEELGPDQLAQSAGESDKRSASVVADERSNRLIVRGTDLFREKVRSLVEKLDTPSTSRGTTKVLRLNHADATKLSELLSNLMGEVTGEDTDGKTGVSVFADEGLNALVVRAEPSRMNEIEFIVEQLDVRRAQVLIEAAIVEISDQAGQDLGVQWAAGDESGGSTPVAGTNFDNVGVSLGQILGSIQAEEAVSPGSGATLAAGQEDRSGISWGVLIQALATSSKANLLSTPSIITLDNEESEIVVGQNVPFRTGQTTNTSDGLSNPFTTIERRDIGLTLNVKPSISADDVVKLVVEQTTEDIGQSLESAADLITEKREIKTSVLADDTETIVLGGLMNEDYRTTESKVPLLGDIPFLGALFRSETRTREKRNLVVFLRPTILREEGEGSGVAKEHFNRLWNVNLGITENEEAEDAERPDVDSVFESNPLPRME